MAELFIVEFTEMKHVGMYVCMPLTWDGHSFKSLWRDIFFIFTDG